MAVRPVWLALAVVALQILVKGEAPYSASGDSETSEDSEDNNDSAGGEAAALDSAGAGGTSLLEDTPEDAKLEERAFTEAALQDSFDSGALPEAFRHPDPIVQAPALHMAVVPIVKAPTVQAPIVDASAVNAPTVQAPNVNAPAVQAPIIDAPIVQAPTVQAQPNLRGPSSLLHVQQPADGQVNASAAADLAIAGLSSKSNALDMEKMVMGMMSGKAAFGATPFGSSVATIRDLIVKDMMPKVLAAHTANQRELDQLNSESLECGATKDTSVGRASVKKRVYLKMSPLHKTCRAGEAGKRTEKTECLSELKDKKGLMQMKCKEYAFTKKKYGDQQANGQIVKKAGNEGDESYVRRLTATICGKYPGGKGGAGKTGFLDEFLIAKESCQKAEREYKEQLRKCTKVTKQYYSTKMTCDNIQDQMDGAACKRAVMMKDACETYAECYYDKKKVYLATEKMVKVEERDRQAEWRGLKRMQCLMDSFEDGKVSNVEIDECKKRVHDVGHLVIKYPMVPELVSCTVPDRYPATAAYKLAEFSLLPSLAKGKVDANECTGVQEIPTKPHGGSPKTCKCERVTLNGPYSPGPLVKCSNCLKIRRSEDKNSCPEGTKLFSPRSESDWKTIMSSVGGLGDPSFIVDITRPQNGCGGCTRKPMNSGAKGQAQYWHTSDGSPWWLRSRTFKEPNGDYQANCYLGIRKPYDDVDNLSFADQGCKFHSKSYYCQLKYISTTPKRGSPPSCKCEKLALTGHYSAGALLKCTGCLKVSKSTQKNSCPVGTKLFAPASSGDWKTFLASAKSLRSPNFIIDVTRPQNGCGGCTKYAMNKRNPAQMTWRTADGAAWWLRSTRYTEPTGDYHANCYMDLWKEPANENTVVFKDHNCKYSSNAYFCQPAKKRR